MDSRNPPPHHQSEAANHTGMLAVESFAVRFNRSLSNNGPVAVTLTIPVEFNVVNVNTVKKLDPPKAPSTVPSIVWSVVALAAA